jgi:hypothetical protein
MGRRTMVLLLFIHTHTPNKKGKVEGRDFVSHGNRLRSFLLSSHHSFTCTSEKKKRSKINQEKREQVQSKPGHTMDDVPLSEALRVMASEDIDDISGDTHARVFGHG